MGSDSYASTLMKVLDADGPVDPSQLQGRMRLFDSDGEPIDVARLINKDRSRFVQSEYLPEVTTNSSTWAALPGPLLVIEVPEDNTPVELMVVGELKADVANAQLRIAIGSLDSLSYQVLDRAGVAYTRMASAPGSGSGTPSVGPGTLTFLASKGQHVIRFEHRHSTGAGIASFRNQRLLVADDVEVTAL